jgi:DNA-binding NtrC family response regulator
VPAHRAHAVELGKLLNAVRQPIYVLDDELCVVFANRACLEWLRGAAEAVVGSVCAYHSAPDASGRNTIGSGLCPPPAVLNGQPCAAAVWAAPEGGPPDERYAHFFPLAADGDVFGVMAVVQSADRPAASGDSRQATTDGTDLELPDAEPVTLHDAIRRFHRESAARYRFDRLIGRGPAMLLARRQAELAAGSRSSVALVGPPGSGRQHLAAAIHYAAVSSRPLAASQAAELLGNVRDPAFLPLDCPLLGADFVGAVLEAVGRAAQRAPLDPAGTLLLHRVDELPAEIQVQLVELLARRLTHWRPIVTAAAPLAELARRGTFHAELAAQLSTITIELPPLAARRDDLPLLAQLFLEDCNAAGSRQIGGFSQAALDRLDAYGWPGNLDELAAVVAEAHGRAAERQIDEADLPERLRLLAQAAAHPRRTEETIVLDEYLRRVERELIRRALARSKGNKARAARLLGVTRPRLYRRMVQLGLEEKRGEGRGERGE